MITLDSALKCKGFSLRAMGATGLVIVEDLTVALDLRLAPAGHICPFDECSIEQLATPPVPPPRRAA